MEQKANWWTVEKIANFLHRRLTMTKLQYPVPFESFSFEIGLEQAATVILLLFF